MKWELIKLADGKHSLRRGGKELGVLRIGAEAAREISGMLNHACQACQAPRAPGAIPRTQGYIAECECGYTIASLTTEGTCPGCERAFLFEWRKK